MSSVSNSYVKQVLKQVKFIVDHRSIKRELNSHITDLIDEHQWQSLSEEELNRHIQEEMGDPNELGKALNKVHKPFIGYLWVVSRSLLIIILCLSFLNFINILDKTAYNQSNVTINEVSIKHIIDSIGTMREKDYSNLKYRDWAINEVIEIDNVILIFERVILTEDNNMILIYRTQPKFNILNQSSSMYVYSCLDIFDQSGNQYFPNNEIQLGMNDKMIAFYNDVPFESKSISLNFEQASESFSIEINGDDYE